MQTIPLDYADITASWLSEALSTRWPGVIVSAVTAEFVIHGAATKVRLRLTYDQPGETTDLPTILWAKSGWEPHSDWLNDTTAIDAREARFYAETGPLGLVNSPRCYFAASDTKGRGIVLLEDLNERRVRFGSCCDAATVDEVAAMLENFARLHARWWNRPDAREVRGLDRPMRRDHPSTEWPRRNGPEVIARYLATSRGDAIPAVVKSPERIDAAFWAMIDDMGAAGGGCLLHGDAHPGNSFFDSDGAPGMYDWQTLSFGPWAHDVSYYLTSALAIEDRRNADERLLRHYLSTLRGNGVTTCPSFDEAWLSHRRYIAYGLHIWITNRIEFQSEENCTAMSTRLGTAADDYEFFRAWGV